MMARVSGRSTTVTITPESWRLEVVWALYSIALRHKRLHLQQPLSSKRETFVRLADPEAKIELPEMSMIGAVKACDESS